MYNDELVFESGLMAEYSYSQTHNFLSYEECRDIEEYFNINTLVEESFFSKKKEKVVIKTVNDIPDEVKKEGETVLKILTQKLKELEKSSEYKKAVDAIKEAGEDYESAYNLSKNINKSLFKIYGKSYNYVYIITVSSDMHQDIFMFEYSKNKFLCNLIDKVCKKVSDDPKVKECKHFQKIVLGDDSYAIEVAFNI